MLVSVPAAGLAVDWVKTDEVTVPLAESVVTTSKSYDVAAARPLAVIVSAPLWPA